MGKFIISVAAFCIVVTGFILISLLLIGGGFFLGVTYIKNRCDDVPAVVSYLGEPIYECGPLGYLDDDIEESVDSTEESSYHYDSKNIGDKIINIPKSE